jgi:hypothetical protein
LLVHAEPGLGRVIREMGAAVMRYEQCEPGIEVNGESLGATVDAFKQYPAVVSKYLVKHGLVKTTNGKPDNVDRSAWYPLDKWLAAYHEIAREIGLNSLYTIGKKIPENATFPAHLSDIRAGLRSLDIAYHLNHRKNGVMMFDAATGVMLEGIGHYQVELVGEERKATIVCEEPYPCEFDRGLITALANRFEPMAKTIHDNSAPCRKKGANTCTYLVSW